MSEDDHNTRAFPRPLGTLEDGSWNEAQPGMSLRDYFAGQALAAIIIGLRNDVAAAGITDDNIVPEPGPAAYHAYQYADAMLAARKED